eukprot:TRINITY_DN17899_c0_g1_i2.p1 TRINITY_DN17899_c0_g1~~TRINITY_DN17899_c0_g1_i2.p1  ORF type:complete len:158 (-),score=2.77 TRINITY_DN17899_c0_g1_i2:631-1104(-)
MLALVSAALYIWSSLKCLYGAAWAAVYDGYSSTMANGAWQLLSSWLLGAVLRVMAQTMATWLGTPWLMETGAGIWGLSSSASSSTPISGGIIDGMYSSGCIAEQHLQHSYSDSMSGFAGLEDELWRLHRGSQWSHIGGAVASSVLSVYMYRMANMMH